MTCDCYYRSFTNVFFLVYRRLKRPNAALQNKKIVYSIKCFSICWREELCYFFTRSWPINEYDFSRFVKRQHVYESVGNRRRTHYNVRMMYAHTQTGGTSDGRPERWSAVKARASRTRAVVTRHNGPTAADHSGGPPTAAPERGEDVAAGFCTFRTQNPIYERTAPVVEPCRGTNDDEPRPQNTPDYSYVRP